MIIVLVLVAGCATAPTVVEYDDPKGSSDFEARFRASLGDKAEQLALRAVPRMEAYRQCASTNLLHTHQFRGLPPRNPCLWEWQQYAAATEALLRVCRQYWQAYRRVAPMCPCLERGLLATEY